MGMQRQLESQLASGWGLNLVTVTELLSGFRLGSAMAWRLGLDLVYRLVLSWV